MHRKYPDPCCVEREVNLKLRWLCWEFASLCKTTTGLCLITGVLKLQKCDCLFVWTYNSTNKYVCTTPSVKMRDPSELSGTWYSVPAMCREPGRFSSRHPQGKLCGNLGILLHFTFPFENFFLLGLNTC